MNVIEKLGITKGPWKSAEFRYRGVNKVHTHEIHYGSDAECVAEYVAVKEDANLISAAPEMLEALIDDALKYDGLGLKYKYWFQRISSIIEKATGKTWEEIKEITNA